MSLFCGINIKNRCLRLILITASMLRIRHYRGHGIHSPFAYSLVRHVFMKRRILSADRSVYNSLREARISRYWAMQIQNLHDHCHNHNLNMILPTQPLELLPSEDKSILCILSPHYSRARYRRCKEIVARHYGMSIDNRGYMLIIYDDTLTKQHYKL